MADVTVMGAGIFGLSVAFACLRRGARVTVIDPRGVGAGASGGTVGALAPHVPENWNAKKAFQFESLLMADGFWSAVADLSGQETGYARTGRLQPVADAAALERARARAKQADSLWDGRARWRVCPAGGFGSWVPASPTGMVVHDTLSARLDPPRACASLAGAIRALGGAIRTEGAARGAVVWATGYRGLEALSRELGRPVGTGVKGQSLLLEHDAGAGAAQLFCAGIHIVAHDNGTVAVGSTSERDFASPDATDAQLDALHARAVSALPRLAGAPVLRRWAGVRPRAASRAPLLGPWPGRQGHYIANGGFKIGFGMAPKVAEVMADLVLEGRDGIPDDFRVEASL